MCGRYTLNKTADDIAKRFNLATKPKDLRENFNVSPSQVMPVIVEDENGKRRIEPMKWGIHRHLFKGGQMTEEDIINTRSENAFGRFWKRTVTRQRCLIPATGFYEWTPPAKGRIPYFIHPKHRDLYAFAGIWGIWKNEAGQEIKGYSIMTTEPNKEMKAIHNRMPLILHKEDEASWIKPSNDEPDKLGNLLFPFEDDGLEIYEVSRDVGNPRNNDKSLLKPVAAQ